MSAPRQDDFQLLQNALRDLKQTLVAIDRATKIEFNGDLLDRLAKQFPVNSIAVQAAFAKLLRK